MAVQGLLFSQSVWSVRFVVQDPLNAKSPVSQVKSGDGFCIKNSSFIALSIVLVITEADVNSDVTGVFISLFYILVIISTRMTAFLKGWSILSQCIDHTRKRQQNKSVARVHKEISYIKNLLTQLLNYCLFKCRWVRTRNLILH
jgi:hypothetical protein